MESTNTQYLKPVYKIIYKNLTVFVTENRQAAIVAYQNTESPKQLVIESQDKLLAVVARIK